VSGILGVWQSRSPAPWQEMIDDLRVLGPDGMGDWHDLDVGLSLARSQLFNTPESCLEGAVIQAQGCVLVWDGRLDDRAALITSSKSTQIISDGQLIIECYRRWGADFLHHLIGEFAFILWDGSQDTLLAGCDRMGGRTLAYFWDGQTLLLSSRALTLLLHPQVDSTLDDSYVAHTLCELWAHEPGSTPFEQIRRLLPGEMLIVRSGWLQRQHVRVLEVDDRPQAAANPDSSYEKFWYLLNQAVSDRLRSHHPACTTLSGGLDSTTVTVALLKHLPTVDAFSFVSDRYVEFDEHQPIEAFLRRYPQVNWHAIDCNDILAMSEPWDELPLPDDPLVGFTLPMHLQMMEQIQQAGFGVVFDGEWGDELFYVGLQDLARQHHWQQIRKHLQADPHWYITLIWELILPQLPQPVSQAYLRRYLRRSHTIPNWLQSDYLQQAPMQTAIAQHFERALVSYQMGVVNWCLESGAQAGINQVCRPLNAKFHLEYTSPLQDQRLLEFALSLPPLMQSHPTQTKVFLREANRETLPEEVRLRPKSNYFDPIKYAGLALGNSALERLEQLKQCTELQSAIDFEQVDASLSLYRQAYQAQYSPGHPFQNSLANQLYSVLTFGDWYQRIQKKYLSAVISL
jgi:asparagine synthase (glutamine-hydrolysing)